MRARRATSYELLLVGLACLHGGCVSPIPDDSITFLSSNNPNIENGVARDIAILPCADCREIVVPAGAEVRECLDAGQGLCKIYMTKRLEVFGHPTKTISINEMRHRAGVAIATLDERAYVSTFGEYEIPNHGGLTVGLQIETFPGLKVVREKGLMGAGSAADKQFRDKSLPTEPQPAAAIPTSGWRRLECQPWAGESN